MEIRPDYLPFGRPNFSDAEVAAVTKVLRSGWIGMGSEVQAFERELAEYVQAPHVVSVSSCTAALQLTLHGLGIGSDDEVLCPSLTWCSTANAALHLGARVRFCDVEWDSLCLGPESVLRELSARTKAVIVVHFGGLAVDVKRLRNALPASVHVVEDAAHALGASYPDGSPVGSSPFPTCFSFYANKNLSTGEGGAVATGDESLAETLRTLRQNGYAANAWKRFTDPRKVTLTPLEQLGYKANYTDLQASIGRVQLSRLPELQARRKQIAQIYCARLSELRPPVRFQRACPRDSHALHLLLVLLPVEQLRWGRDGILLRLRERNIGATLHYTPLHQMPLYRERCGKSSLPVTEDLGSRLMTLPISSSMTVEDAHYVCDHLSDILREAARESSG